MTLQEQIDRIVERLDEVPGAPVFWTNTEIVDALNEAQRFFALLTLCLEKTANLTIAPATAYHKIISHSTTPIADFMLPLRAAIQGRRLKTRTIHQLNLENQFWARTSDVAITFPDLTRGPKPTTHYAILGCDLLAVYPQDDEGATLVLTYAASPVLMTLADTLVSPEIPVEYHPVLPDFAIYLLMHKVGGQEFANEIPRLKTFLDEANRLAMRVRTKMKAQGYERVPFDLTSTDVAPLIRQMMTVKLTQQPRLAA